MKNVALRRPAGPAAMLCLAAAVAWPAYAQEPPPGSNSGPNNPSGTPTIPGSPSGATGATGASPMGGMGRAWNRGDGYSLLPYTRRGYIGLNLGKPEFNSGCGTPLLFSCEDPDIGGYLYTGGLVNDWFGAEVGYLHTGNANRAGGRTSAQGVNLSLVLRAPLGAFNLFAKGGAMYAQTRVSADLLSGVSDGKQRDWAGTYAVGAGFDFTRNSGVVLEWSRYRLRFPGGERSDVDRTSLGYVHRF